MHDDEQKKEPYFGSVRFFKNLILTVILLAILIPSGLAVYLYTQWAPPAPPAPEIPVAEEPIEPEPPAETETLEIPEEPAESEPLAEDPPAYQALYPDFYAPEEYHADQRVLNTIYLTFDDGPSARTDEILQTLAAEDVKATFFVTGQDTPAGRQRMQAIVEQGHTIAMHSYSHNYAQIYGSVEAFLDDLYGVFCLIRDATGVTPTLFRFPGGSINGYNGGIYQEIISEMMRRGFVPFDWNISSEDATGAKVSADDICDNVVRAVTSVSRGIVLMHDSASKTATAQALKPMITTLKEMGFSFAPLTPEVKPVLFSYRE